MLEAAGLSSLLSAVVAAEDVPRGKPAPDGYLRALELVDGELAASDVLVFEDAEAGIVAAKAAGMSCIAVLGTLAPERLATALNARLPDDVSALRAEAVPDAFHARYSARWRRYRYRYLDRPGRPALDRGRCWHLAGDPLDVKAMSSAAEALVGEHDWTSFCSASEPAGQRVREMRSAKVRRRGEFVELELVAEGFLRGLARSIAGALAEVGRGRKPVRWVADVLKARDRRMAPKTAPAGGLTLMEVIY